MTQMTERETVARFLRAEYGPLVDEDVIAETIENMGANEIGAVVSAVRAQPELAVNYPVLEQA